jgi:hypothetical protein
LDLLTPVLSTCLILQRAGTAEPTCSEGGNGQCAAPGRLPQTLQEPEKLEEIIVVERNLLPKLALAQGLFYLATGVWPLIDIVSFQLVTGPKTDLWLVRTVGVLVSVVGAVLIAASRTRRITPEIVMLAVGSALGLAAIDLRYALAGRISAVYLADAVVEIGLSLAWWMGWRRAHVG